MQQLMICLKIQKLPLNNQSLKIIHWIYGRISVDVNLTGVFLCSQILGTEMTIQKSGSIINIASTYGISAPDQSLYLKKYGSQTFLSRLRILQPKAQ